MKVSHSISLTWWEKKIELTLMRRLRQRSQAPEGLPGLTIVQGELETAMVDFHIFVTFARLWYAGGHLYWE